MLEIHLELYIFVEFNPVRTKITIEMTTTALIIHVKAQQDIFILIWCIEGWACAKSEWKLKVSFTLKPTAGNGTDLNKPSVVSSFVKNDKYWKYLISFVPSTNNELFTSIDGWTGCLNFSIFTKCEVYNFNVTSKIQQKRNICLSSKVVSRKPGWPLKIRKMLL